MNSAVIRVENLFKKFRYWDDRPTTFKSVLVKLAKFDFDFGSRREFVCLSGVSFEIPAGQFVGIMGKNGAGKSTLMKLMSGIYQPTSGSIRVNGSLAPLIELGAGFNGELSGYENIFLNASILGFGRKATMKALPAILEFSELGDRIHMPVKNYSSGMLVRLGFSIATHLDAQILLVDEVLAVGDIGFQEKCLRKIHELHQSGRTIILITHSPEAVLRHCQRCIVIADQKVAYDGPVEKGVEVYRGVAG